MTSLPLHGRPDTAEKVSWVLAGIALVLVLELHLLLAFLGGLLVFELVHIIAPALARRLFDKRARIVAVAILAALIVGLLTGGILGIIAFARSEGGSLSGLLQKMAEILGDAKSVLPAWMLPYLPGSVDDIRAWLSEWLREHASDLRLAGADFARGLLHLLVGMIIGAMVALNEAVQSATQKPLARALTRRAEKIGDAFRRVVFAQVRISALNTLFTAIYLLVVLPLIGVHLPFGKTLVAVTFVAGLLPVVGNLISNTAIVVVSLAYSVYVAFGSLAFLIVIHKLEYFLNARIVGTRIRARPWELLIAMLVMESAFGVPGLAAAPIYYAYLKAELSERGLV